MDYKSTSNYNNLIKTIAYYYKKYNVNYQELLIILGMTNMRLDYILDFSKKIKYINDDERKIINKINESKSEPIDRSKVYMAKREYDKTLEILKNITNIKRKSTFGNYKPTNDELKYIILYRDTFNLTNSDISKTLKINETFINKYEQNNKQSQLKK